MYCYLLSLDMDGCHISDPHIPMRTLSACVYCILNTAFPAARATRTPSPAYACGGCYQRVSSQTRVYPALWVYPAVLSTLLLELVVAVELLAVAQSLRVRVAPQEPVAKTHMNSGYQRARRTVTQPVPTRADATRAHAPQ